MSFYNKITRALNNALWDRFEIVVKHKICAKLKLEEILLRSRDMGRVATVRRWTPTATECYKRGCNCNGCFYQDFFSGSSQKCQMKAAVLELVRTIGTPNVELQQVLLD